MLVFSRQNLALLAVPKTGSTALETALRHRADVIYRGPFRHMTARRFARRVRPLLEQGYGVAPEVVAVMREPTDRIASWWRYRSRPEATHGVGDMAFAEFVEAVLSPDPPPWAGVGDQHAFLTQDGRLAVDHLFAYEAMPRLLAFLSERFGEDVALPRKNVSRPRRADLPPALAARLRGARADEYALHARLTEAGGYLGPGSAAPAG